MSVAVNFVQIPVRVKDSSGRLVPGLTSNDFKVYEDGVVQQLKFFTADAFPAFGRRGCGHGLARNNHEESQ